MLQPNMDAMLSNLSRPCAASTDPQTRGESNSVQGASVKQTRSVCSERARAPAGGRSRCVFAKQIRGFSAQRPGPISMRCRLSSGCPCPRINGFPVPRRIELCAGRERKENAVATQTGTRFPNGSSSGKSIPESPLRTGRAFRQPPRPPQLQNQCALYLKTG